jgi:hypothetical protein
LTRSSFSAGNPGIAARRRLTRPDRRAALAALALALALAPVAGLGVGPAGAPVVPNGPAAHPQILGSGASTVNVTPGGGYVGAYVNVTGGGYTNSTPLNLTFNATIAIDCLGTSSNVTNLTGNFTCMFAVPAVAAGTYLVNASDGTDNGSGPFSVLLPSLFVDPTSGPVSSSVTATGDGYDPGGPAVSLRFGPDPVTSCASGSLVASAMGALDCAFLVPPLTQGMYSVTAESTAGANSTTYAVGLPSLTPFTASGHVASSFALSGTGFDPSATLVLTFGTLVIPGTSCRAGSLTTNATGSFACTFGVPWLPAGIHEIEASDANNSGFANFTITPALTLSPVSGAVGVLATVGGSGFAASTAFSVAWNLSVTACTGTTNSTGGLSCSFTVPHNHAGPNPLTATAGSTTASKTFTVVPSFDFSPLSGAVGSSVAVFGVGYDASQPFNVTYDWTDEVCLANTDTLGDLECSFTVPAATQGIHTVTVHEGTFNDSETFTVATSVMVSPTSGIAGTTTLLNATGLAGATTYAYCFASSAAACPGGAPTFLTNGVGSSPAGIPVSSPYGASPGVYYVVVSLASTVEGYAEFTITSAVLTITPTSGPVGAVVTLSGTMFLANEQYSYCFSPTAGTCTGSPPQFMANASGDIPAGTTLVVPFSPYGGYFVDVVQSGILVADAGFAVNASLSLSPSTGPVGSAVTAVGTGLDATTGYLLTWAGAETVCTGATNSTGSFSCTFGVPATAQGPALATASVGTQQPSATFTVVPSLLLDPDSGMVAAAFEASGEGYGAGVDYSVEWNGSGFLCGGTTTNLGAFECSGTVPSEPAGTYPVNGTGGRVYAIATFTVVASVSLSDTTGFAGSSVTAGGAGFDANTEYTVTWDGSTQLCSGSTAGEGTFSCTFTVPVAVGGVHTVTASEGPYAPTTQFTLGASLTLSPSSGPVGTSVTATGEGYAAAGAYAVTWSTGASLCAGTTVGNGAFSCRFTVPAAPGGPFSIRAAQGSNEAGADFTVGPSVDVQLPSGPVGTVVTVTGAGLSADASVTVAWNNATTECDGTANSSGGFACNFTVPWATAGAHSIEILQGSLAIGSTFTVVPSFASNITTGGAGTGVALTGTGFDPNSPYSIHWNSTTEVCTGTTNATGTFVCAFAVPAGAPVGPQTVSVTEGQHTLSVTFTVASSPTPSTGAAPFPWWIVVVIALVVGLLLLLFIVGERQRRTSHHRHAGHGGTTHAGGPWSGFGAGSGPGSAASDATGTTPVSSGDLAAFDAIAGGPAAAPTTTESPEDIDAMIARLERMSQQLYKKKPKELGDVGTAQLPAEEEPPAS